MPELPEVETIRRGLERELVGRRFESTTWRGARLRAASPVPLEHAAGAQVRAVHRHGKFLRLELDQGRVLGIHLGMTGKLVFAPDADAPERPHTHFSAVLDDGRRLDYADPRRFGSLRLYGPGMPVDDTAHYGPDALEPGFDTAYLASSLSASRAPLKAFLLDQTKVAGIGNIYACEALWRSGLSPRRVARNTPKSKVPVLRDHIIDVLQQAIDNGGTSFNDYVDTIGEPGRFLTQLAVFQREGAPCPRCGREVKRIVQSNRSTFYCPGCQR